MTELDGDIVDVEDDPAAGSVEAFDVTLAWAVFVSSLVVAGVGQIFMHLEQNGERKNLTISKQFIFY